VIFSGWLCSFLGLDVDNSGNDLGFFRGGIAALVVMPQALWKYVYTLDTAIIITADTIAGDIQGLLDGIAFRQTAYVLDRDWRKAALARFLKRASVGDLEVIEDERRLAHRCCGHLISATHATDVRQREKRHPCRSTVVLHLSLC
jgi:hypothetical protein